MKEIDSLRTDDPIAGTLPLDFEGVEIQPWELPEQQETRTSDESQGIFSPDLLSTELS